jgi:hypothetical protein
MQKTEKTDAFGSGFRWAHSLQSGSAILAAAASEVGPPMKRDRRGLSAATITSSSALAVTGVDQLFFLVIFFFLKPALQGRLRP